MKFEALVCNQLVSARTFWQSLLDQVQPPLRPDNMRPRATKTVTAAHVNLAELALGPVAYVAVTEPRREALSMAVAWVGKWPHAGAKWVAPRDQPHHQHHDPQPRSEQ